MAEKSRISVTTQVQESQKCDLQDDKVHNGSVNGKPVSPLNGATITPAAPGEVRNPEGHNQYNTLTRKGMEELLAGNKVDLTIAYEDAHGAKKTKRLHFEMQDGQPLHRGVAGILLGKALAGDMKAITELNKIVNGAVKLGDGEGGALPPEIKIVVVNAVSNK